MIDCQALLGISLGTVDVELLLNLVKQNLLGSIISCAEVL